MVGLDGAGKTTMLSQLKRNEAPTETVPTIGFHVETIAISDNVKMCIMDVGGQDRIRELWKHYYDGAHAIIFVVDSNDHERFKIAKKELNIALNDSSLKDALLLVLANKQDIDSAASVTDVADELNLGGLKERKWFIQGCCATTGHGIWAGMYWLISHLGQADAASMQ
eukprot:CAMPEP_0174261088 /NCGR_PEP_ID=MMETSP0439-20130205/11225_1 /TAXON_ID=0 /ORGANISM="Stereomyxa ramosa, Strain Chinc5" /LENGTH=167 /DNA_ID=CAMNT_0015345507 /DNA_START=158 /DNA_END=661 /DNA_ORIENTATION=-